MAAHKGHKELVGLLLEKGADVTLTHLDGRTPLFVACQFGHIEVIIIFSSPLSFSFY